VMGGWKGAGVGGKLPKISRRVVGCNGVRTQMLKDRRVNKLYGRQEGLNRASHPTLCQQT
jgi:hypothetical protein